MPSLESDRQLQPQGELNPAPIDYQAEIREAFSNAAAIIKQDASTFYEGIQYSVLAPKIPIHSEEEYRQVMNEPSPINIAIFSRDYNFFVRQQLGVLNITGLNTSNVHIDFRSLTGGTNFEVFIGETVDVHGVQPEIASRALTLLLKTRQYKGVDSQKTIHLAKPTNLKFFNPDGTPRENK